MQAAVGCASGASVAEVDHNATHNVIFTPMYHYVDTTHALQTPDSISLTSMVRKPQPRDDFIF
eukprot:COSAG06_NODE_313_length_17764_cov_4.287235_22_plen_63_part_00